MPCTTVSPAAINALLLSIPYRLRIIWHRAPTMTFSIRVFSHRVCTQALLWTLKAWVQITVLRWATIPVRVTLTRIITTGPSNYLMLIRLFIPADSTPAVLRCPKAHHSGIKSWTLPVKASVYKHNFPFRIPMTVPAVPPPAMINKVT